MFLKIHYRKILVVAAILSCLAAIYCIPFIDIHPEIPKPRPKIHYDFSRPPLSAKSAKQFKIEKLFTGQIHGPESIEVDPWGNLYMAIEGGFVLFGQMNQTTTSRTSTADSRQAAAAKLWLLAELNEQPEFVNNSDQGPNSSSQNTNKVTSQRACQLDDQLYGSPLSVGGNVGNFHSKMLISRCSKPLGIRLSRNQDYLYVIDTLSGLYRINLGLAHQRLHESVNSGLGETRAPIKEKLLDFHIKTKQQVPLERMDNEIEHHKTTVGVALTAMDDLVIDYGAGTNGADVLYMTDASQLWPAVSYVFDLMEARPSGLVIKFDTGTKQLTVLDNAHLSRVRMAASVAAKTPSAAATSRRGSEAKGDSVGGAGAGAGAGEKKDGATLTDSTKEIAKEEPVLVFSNKSPTLSHNVSRTDSNALLSAPNEANFDNSSIGRSRNNGYFDRVGVERQLGPPYELGKGYGAPRFDADDIFDDRPLFFPNGLELMDDQQALLIAETSNKRIIKHYIRGPRRGQSDLWTWTPHYPDNIRRGGEANEETYWTAGCGRDRSTDGVLEGLIDDQSLNEWPRIRMFLLKNIYLMGWIVEKIGQWLLRSQSVRDYGYALKMGISLMDNACDGVMMLQYDRHGQLIKSIHGRDFPHDMRLLSQITHVLETPIGDSKAGHRLYLGSPVYNYVYRLTYPTG